MTTLKMYDELATWWPLLSPVEDYEEEAAFFLQSLVAAGLPAEPSLLELGCGGGSNAFYLKRRFAQVTLSDLSPAMLAVSAALNPDCEHLQGDMRTLRLGRLFEVVFVHDAIMYMTTLADLRLVFETAFVHLRPGGLALFVPDNVTETFEPATELGGEDGSGRSLRFLEWDNPANGFTYATDYVYVLREVSRPVRVEHETHLNGLFPRAEWLRLLHEVGFQANSITDSFGRDLFLARKS